MKSIAAILLFLSVAGLADTHSPTQNLCGFTSGAHRAAAQAESLPLCEVKPAKAEMFRREHFVSESFSDRFGGGIHGKVKIRAVSTDGRIAIRAGGLNFNVYPWDYDVVPNCTQVASKVAGE